jgi:hypothetical protein
MTLEAWKLPHSQAAHIAVERAEKELISKKRERERERERSLLTIK